MLHAGQAEAIKAVTHGTVGALVAVCAVYNICAFIVRRERHLALNSILYVAGAAYETYQTVHHARAARGQ